MCAAAVNPSERIVNAQYFIYFGVMGIYLPYFNLYCYRLNFSGSQIGALSATRTVTLVVFPLLWGLLADRYALRRPIYIFCNFSSTLVWSLLLFTADFWTMLVITAVYGLFYAPLISFLEAVTMEMLGKGRARYGKIRAWGSMSFILVTLLMGKVISLYSVRITVALILVGSLLQAIVALRIPAAAGRKRKAGRFSLGRLFTYRMVIFLVSAFLMLASHGTYYGFFSIHLDNLGYSGTFIGFCWALASAAEILVMISSDRIFGYFSLERILSISFLVAALRWLILFWTPAAGFILFSQLLHAATYAAFHMASILYIDVLTPTGAKTTGQAINNAVSYGLGLMVSFFANGFLYKSMGLPALFLMSAAISAVGGILFTFFHDR